MNEADAPVGVGQEPSTPAALNTIGEAVSVVKGSALLFAARIAGNAGFFVAVLLLTRALSVPNRGQFAFITTASQVIARVASLGVTEATVVFTAKEPQHRGRLLTNVFLFTGVSAALASGAFCVALALVHGSLPRGLTGIELALLAAGTVASAVAGAGNAFLAGCGRWRAQAIASAASPWLYALLLAVIWTQEALTVEISLVIWVAYYGIWAGALIIPAVKVTPFGRPSRALFGRSLKFGLRAWAGSVTLLLNYRTDQLLMGFIASQAVLGTYVVAVNASEILLILPQAAATALLPVLARSFEASRGERTLRVFRVLSVTSLLAMVVFGAVGPFLLPVVFGSSYRSAVVPFLWLLAGTIGFVASEVFAQALLATSSPGLASVAPVTALAVGFTLDLILIPRLGATGAAIAAAASFTTGGLVAFFAYRRRVPFSYRLLLPVRADLDLTRSAVMQLVRSARS
jgi:O-antigen/teichoic acid export membrane protein